MKKIIKNLVVASALTFSAIPALANVTLFGQNLATVNRDAMRVALREASVKPEREDNSYWVDLYDGKGVLDEATQLAVGYRGRDNRLAYVSYTFNSFMDTGQVVRVANLVSQRYGRHDERRGDPSLGDVTYRWKRHGMLIEVSRGWPSTSTTLQYTNQPVLNDMQAEIKAEKDRQAREKANQQQGRF